MAPSGQLRGIFGLRRVPLLGERPSLLVSYGTLAAKAGRAAKTAALQLYAAQSARSEKPNRSLTAIAAASAVAAPHCTPQRTAKHDAPSRD